MKNLFLISIFLLITQLGYAQIGINAPNPDATFHIKSSNQASPTNKDGILIPKINVFPATNPTVAQQSMMVYLTTLSGGKQPGFYYWDNATVTWKSVAGNAGWELLGNSGTSAAYRRVSVNNGSTLRNTPGPQQSRRTAFNGSTIDHSRLG